MERNEGINMSNQKINLPFYGIIVTVATTFNGETYFDGC